MEYLVNIFDLTGKQIGGACFSTRYNAELYCRASVCPITESSRIVERLAE